MGILFSIVAVWFIASVPFSLFVGRALATRDAQPQREVVELITSNGDVISIY